MASPPSSPIERWLLPEIGGEHVVAVERANAGFSGRQRTAAVGSSSHASSAPMTRGRLAELERVTREEGYTSGRAEGYEKGFAEGETRARELGVEQTVQQRQQLASLIDSVTLEVTRQQSSLREIITDLVIKICTALCQRELQYASNVDTIVVQALQALPIGEQHVQIYLNPNDLTLLESLRETKPGLLKSEWKLVAEPAMQQGGCRVQSDHSEVDASFQRRLQDIIAATFTERQNDAAGMPDDSAERGSIVLPPPEPDPQA